MIIFCRHLNVVVCVKSEGFRLQLSSREYSRPSSIEDSRVFVVNGRVFNRRTKKLLLQWKLPKTRLIYRRPKDFTFMKKKKKIKAIVNRTFKGLLYKKTLRVSSLKCAKSLMTFSRIIFHSRTMGLVLYVRPKVYLFQLKFQAFSPSVRDPNDNFLNEWCDIPSM